MARGLADYEMWALGVAIRICMNVTPGHPNLTWSHQHPRRRKRYGGVVRGMAPGPSGALQEQRAAASGGVKWRAP
jgi:hypothetical protein